MKNVAIFGSTGSIGENSLNVIRQNPNLFNVVTLVAGKNINKLIKQIDEFKPKNVYIIDKENAKELKSLYNNINIFYEDEGLEDISQLLDFDIAVCALVGIVGLKPTYNMIKNGKTIALANKEVLVTAGNIIMNAVKKYNAKLITIDSEHSAIMQCLNGEDVNTIDKILLTASGGPFFNKEISKDITVEEALNHPTWNMGAKITIDSATMMNKGFEIIEAKYLFNVEVDQIEVVVHRQSLVHSMVQFKDGTIMANIAPKSMQIPIAYALNYPYRMKNDIQKLDLFKIKELKFEKPDLDKFKCLKLAYEAIKMGDSYQVVLNASNEVLVDLFLNKKINFISIQEGIEKMLNMYEKKDLETVEEVLEFDKLVKKQTSEYINNNLA